jgi:hypothetical protein
MSAYARTLYQYKHLLGVDNISEQQKREAKKKLSEGVQGFLPFRKPDGGFVVSVVSVQFFKNFVLLNKFRILG